MMEWFDFWMGRYLVEAALALVFIAAMGLVLLMIWGPRWVKQARCSHERVFETGGCDAICKSCHKNLGFIGEWSKSREDM